MDLRVISVDVVNEVMKVHVTILGERVKMIPGEG